jgi:hypothetical protein
VYREVPETRRIEEPYTVMVPESRTRTVLDTVNRPVYHDIELRLTALVPHTEARRSTRTVCCMVPVQEQRTVCEASSCCASAQAVDSATWASSVQPPAGVAPAVEAPTLLHTAVYQTAVYQKVAAAENAPILRRPDNSQAKRPSGEWQVSSPPPPPTVAPATAAPPAATPATVPAPGPLAGGGCDTCGKPACCPDVVPRTTTVTCLRPAYRQETIEYPVTLLQPRVQNQSVSFYEYQPQQIPREEQYTVDVPHTRVRTKEITVMRSVAVQQQEEYTVMVAYQKQIQVPVVRCVPQTIVLPCAPSCGSCGP